MVRTLNSALVAIVVSLSGMTAAFAQLPVLAPDAGMVSHEEVLSFLRQIDQNVVVKETQNGGRAYNLTLRIRNANQPEVAIPITVIVDDNGITVGTPMTGAIDANRVSHNVHARLDRLNGRAMKTKLVFIPAQQQGRVILVAVHPLNRNITINQFRRSFGSS